MAVHSTHMKRIVAKEFLLLVGCVLVVLFVALFGLARNAWLTHHIKSHAQQIAHETILLDSLRPLTSPKNLHFINLFDSAFVSKQAQLLLICPAWTKGLNPFLRLNRVYVSQLSNTLISIGYDMNINSSDIKNSPKHEVSIIELGRELKAIYPEELGRMADTIVGISAVHESPLAFSSVNTLGNPSWQFKPETEESINLCSEKLRRILLESINAKSASQFDRGEFVVKLPDGTLVAFPIEMTVSEVADVIVSMESREAILNVQRLHKVESHTMLKETKRLWMDAKKDSSLQSPNYLLASVLIGESMPHVELQMAYDYLVRKGVLNCSFNELLFTMQRKPVPPSQETLDAFAKQKANVDRLHKERSDAQASLWSEVKLWAVVKWAAIVLLMMVYPLRLLVLGTLWAVRTMRS
jgi:hypothetical protein